MRNEDRRFIEGQAQAYAYRVKEEEINKECVEGLLFADADSCNVPRLDKAALFYYGMGFFNGCLAQR